MKVIALCPQSHIFWRDKLLDHNFASNYPGGGWVRHLKDLANASGIEVHTGDVVKEMIERGEIHSQHVVIYQEEDSTPAVELAQEGAARGVIVSLESPLFAGRFYNNLPEISAGYRHALLFRGAHDRVAKDVVPHTAYFPSYTAGDLPGLAHKPHSRLALISANKYWKPTGWSARSIARRAKYAWKGPIYAAGAAGMQLHDYRLRFIEFFADRGLDLLGPGWNRLSGVPRGRRGGLTDVAARAQPVPYRQKVERLSSYKFAACIENAIFPGYVTEKIVDSLVAGAVPLYMGAPDINDFIPRDAFIDLRDFECFEELDDYLNAMDGATWTSYRSAGRSFLESTWGARFGNLEFAKRVFELALRSS